MSITAECTSCGRRYEAPASMAGKRVRCKQCGNIFALPDASFEESPDLDALAAVEQSFHSVDATDAGGSGVRDSDEDDESGESVAPLRTGRRSIRFNFPLAGELDAWLPRLLMLAGLGWLAWFCITRTETGSPPWLPYVRLATALIAYFVFIAPITYIMITKAGRQLGYQMPTGDKMRAYASYLPAFVLGYVLWISGGGRLPGLILGCIAGVVLATLFLWFLFRLTPAEIAPSATYALVGFFVGLTIAGAVFFGLNTLTLGLIRGTKNPNLVPSPASPFGPQGTLVWISAEERQQLLDERARQTRPPPQPTPTGPVVTPGGETPPPEPELSPIVRSMQIAPVATFDELIRPLTESTFRATARRVGGTIAVQVWNMQNWQRGKGTSFTASERFWENRYALSADGKLLARTAAFPKDSLQVWEFDRDRVGPILDQPQRPNQTPDLLGFVDANRILVLWQNPSGSEASIEVRDLARTQETRTVQLAPRATSGTTLALNREGTLAAVATKVDSIPSLLIYSIETGMLLGTTRIDSLDTQWAVQPTGMSFSADSGHLAVLFEEAGNGLLLAYQINAQTGAGTKVREWLYPAGPIPNRDPRFSGNAVQWLPDGKSWLLYGKSVFSVASGQRIDDLGVNSVESAWVSGSDMVEIISRGSDGQRQYRVLRLNMERISAAATPR